MPVRTARHTPSRARKRAAPPRASTRAAPRGRPLVEPPHGHIVCRGCGRIHPLELSTSDLEILTGMTGRGPSGWSAERVAYSIAAVCPKCQRPSAPA